MLGRVPNQPARIVHLVHDGIAGVDAGGAGDALVLQPVADVDAGRTNLHAQGAVDAIAEAEFLRVRRTLAAAARLAALLVIGNDQRVFVEHRALEARVRTHVFADLLAHVAGIAVGREAVEQNVQNVAQPPAEKLSQLGPELADWYEIADESEPGPQAKKSAITVAYCPYAEACSSSTAPCRASCAASGCPRSTVPSR